jgi:hypothetical protein
VISSHCLGPRFALPFSLGLPFVLVLVLALTNTGCLFAPNLDAHGYTSCTEDAVCAAGRLCQSEICSPPAWRDPDYLSRRLVAVKNNADTEIRAGAAISVKVGPDGDLALDDVGPQGRFTHFGREGGWREVPVYRDLFSDGYTAYIPLAEDLKAGDERALVWVESEPIQDKEGAPVVDPMEVFEHFDSFDDPGDGADPLADDYRTYGLGEVQVAEGTVRIGDGQELVGRTALEQPLSITFKARLVGAGCNQVFIGLKADDAAGYVAPQAGFFLDSPGQVQALIAPEETSLPLPVATVPLTSALHRFTIELDSGNARFILDGETIAEEAPVVPAFSASPLFIAVEVQDTCTVELEEWWSTPLPFASPTLRTENPVTFELFD